MTEPDRCPHCDADLQGMEIPEEARYNFGGATHFSRRINVYDWNRDRTTHYRCPDCGKEWPR